MCRKFIPLVLFFPLFALAHVHAQVLEPSHSVFHLTNGTVRVEEIDTEALRWTYGYDNIQLYTSRSLIIYAISDVPKITFGNEEGVKDLPTSTGHVIAQDIRYWQVEESIRVIAPIPIHNVQLVTLAGEVLTLAGEGDTWFLPFDIFHTLYLLRIMTDAGVFCGKIIIGQ